MKQGILALFALLAPFTTHAVLIAGWDFQTTTNGGTAIVAAPSTQTSFVANVGTLGISAKLFLDGSNGSSSWSSATELNAFTGTALNAGSGMSTTTTGAASLALLGGTGLSANGKNFVFSLSAVGLEDLVLTYATQGTATGFNSQAWAYSLDAITFTPFATVGSIQTSFDVKTVDFSAVAALEGATNVYIRGTVSGATGASGNNRLDNVQFNASPIAGAIPEPSQGIPLLIGIGLVCGLTRMRWSTAMKVLAE